MNENHDPKGGREDGHKAADNAANAQPDNWRATALAAIRLYASNRKAPFLTVEVRKWATNEGGVRKPTEPRAWGGVILDAKRQGIIKPVGKLQPRHMHGGVATQWIGA